ncbi:MAG TPA: GNAT family N-acetyltransferase [Candidatus Limnocylindrales bacterium]|nr:GNAT family N-acetyltransferase [Candidatus Limnocylindrales bacterium]
MTAPTLDVEPACPGAPTGPTSSPSPAASEAALEVQQRPLTAIPREAWDELAAATPWATPFSGYAFHRAWWDAYGANAHEQTLVVCRPDASRPLAIVPLMHRHEVEPDDELTKSTMRHGGPTTLTPVAPTAKAVFFGASYHADYATILAAPESLPAVASAVVDHLAAPPSPLDPHPTPWDVVDLRRLRCGDPAADALAAEFGRREIAEGWTLNVEREDVCPVVNLPPDASFDDYLSTLGKKERHEIRRKIRRAEGAGEIALTDSADPLAELEAFIDLHQKRWGALGLFPPTPGGDASRTFVRRMFEEHGADGPLRLAFLTVGTRRIAAGIHFRTDDGFLYYNAGVDPDARDLSPGVLMVAEYVRRALAEGVRRLDLLRGDEPYKYEWGAVDEPIQRLLVRRDAARDAA